MHGSLIASNPPNGRPSWPPAFRTRKPYSATCSHMKGGRPQGPPVINSFVVAKEPGSNSALGNQIHIPAQIPQQFVRQHIATNPGGSGTLARLHGSLGRGRKNAFRDRCAIRGNRIDHGLRQGKTGSDELTVTIGGMDVHGALPKNRNPIWIGGLPIQPATQL